MEWELVTFNRKEEGEEIEMKWSTDHFVSRLRIGFERTLNTSLQILTFIHVIWLSDLNFTIDSEQISFKKGYFLAIIDHYSEKYAYWLKINGFKTN